MRDIPASEQLFILSDDCFLKRETLSDFGVIHSLCVYIYIYIFVYITLKRIHLVSTAIIIPSPSHFHSNYFA